jgi:hypothetical protein
VVMNFTETACTSVAMSTLVGEARYVADRSKDPGHCNRRTRRQYWVQADVRCVLFERSIGRVLAVAGSRRDAPVAYWPVLGVLQIRTAGCADAQDSWRRAFPVHHLWWKRHC